MASVGPALATVETIEFAGAFESGPLVSEAFSGTFDVDVDNRFAPQEVTFMTTGFSGSKTVAPNLSAFGNDHTFDFVFDTGERLEFQILKARIFSLSDSFLHDGAGFVYVNFTDTSGTSVCTPGGLPCPISLAVQQPAAPTPAPAALGLFALGLAGLAALRSRGRPV
jgi:hypothetical protein